MRHNLSTRSIPTFPVASLLLARMLGAGILLLMLLLFPSRSAAHPFSVGECKEASDFIKNAALARDNGIAEEVFLDKIRDDIEIIRAFPLQLRWFIKDDGDAEFLLAAVMNVFQNPKPARAHQIDFFGDCIANAKATSNTSKISM